MHRHRRASLALCFSVVGCGLFGGRDGDGGGGDDGDGSDDCPAEMALLVGTWITPQGASTSDQMYATLTLNPPSSGGEVLQVSFGARMRTPIVQWRLEPGCTELHWDYYGTGWLADYSVIHQLTGALLELEATDGSYYGQRTLYDRVGGGGDTPCADPDLECEVCWEQGRDCMGTGSCNSCGEINPSFSDTCQQPCGVDGDCADGEACLLAAQGNICLPPDCQGCWNSGQDCSTITTTCTFESCS